MAQTNDLEKYLKKHFDLETFRTGQREIISDVMLGKDVLGVLPTGSGKSLCYQLPAQLLTGQTIVVSPLISLMEDQVKQLKANGIKNVVALNSFMSYAERQHAYNHLEKYALIYVSPEILQQNDLLNRLKQLTVSLFVIDEAHCISQWGHEFRPDYLRLTQIIQQLNNPPILALSATITKQIEQDILMSLNRPHMVKHIYPINRPNIILNVKQVVDNTEKNLAIIQFLKDKRVPTLIYFSSRKATEKMTHIFQTNLPEHRIAFYHGGMDTIDRILVQQQFMNNQLDIVCCTSAFGMGIDKNDIRLIIHYHIPSQIESFIQEIGRGGRDGQTCISLVLHHAADRSLPQRLIANELPTNDQIVYVFQQLKHIYENNEKLPKTDESIIHTFNCDLIQWRFLFYQFEKSGIIKDNQLIYNEDKWQRVIHHIQKIRDQRYVHKQQQLNDMIQWLETSTCFRHSLYEKFQTSKVDQQTPCCQHCGFNLNEWQPNIQTPVTETIETWESRLKYILSVEGFYEPERNH